MFEQSLLMDDRIAKKTGAFAASLTAQILFVGVSLLVPLIYQEVLPMVRITEPLALPVFIHNAPPPTHSQTQSSVTTARLNKPFIFPMPPPKTGTPVLLEEHFDAAPGFPPGVDTGTSSPFPFTSDISRFRLPPPSPPDPPHAAAGPKPEVAPTPIGGVVLASKLMKKVVPVYPPLAVRARVSGVVHLMGVVSKEGTIKNLQLISGPPLLVRAAIDAVQQWIYSPTLLNGKPVEVAAPIDVVFNLQN